MRSDAPQQPVVVYGVTSGISAATLLRGQLGWIADHGYRVILVSSPDEAARNAATREGVDLLPIAMTRSISPLADLRALVQWVGVLRRTRPQAVNASTPKAALLGHLAAWLTRVPRRIYVVRGLRVEGASGLASGILWAMERLTMALATEVVMVSASLAREAQRRRLIRPGRARLIGAGSSNGVNAPAIARRVAEVEPATLRDRLGLPTDAFVVGFIGRVAADKGVDTILRALADPRLAAQTHLLVIGEIEDEALTSQIAALGDRVRVVPWTDDVWGHLPALDVLCLPTKREGFPNVVLEAAAAGIPAIATRATGAIDSVIDGRTGFLIDVGDDSALIQRLNQLADDPTLRAELGAAARIRAADDYAPERIWQGVLSITDGRVGAADVHTV